MRSECVLRIHVHVYNLYCRAQAKHPNSQNIQNRYFYMPYLTKCSHLVSINLAENCWYVFFGDQTLCITNVCRSVSRITKSLS